MIWSLFVLLCHFPVSLVHYSGFIESSTLWFFGMLAEHSITCDVKRKSRQSSTKKNQDKTSLRFIHWEFITIYYLFKSFCTIFSCDVVAFLERQSYHYTLQWPQNLQFHSDLTFYLLAFTRSSNLQLLIFPSCDNP